MADSKPAQKLFDNIVKLIFGCAAGVFIIAAFASVPVVFGLVAIAAVLTAVVMVQRRRTEELRNRNRDLQRDLDRARSRW